MHSASDDRFLVIGVGNAYQNDDRTGLILAMRLQGKRLPNTKVVTHDGEGSALLDLWKEWDYVILLDAVRSGSPPGMIHRFDLSRKPIPRQFFRHSTHAIGIGEALELARLLKRLPRALIVYGIEGKNFEAGENISHEVKVKMNELVGQIAQEILKFQQKAYEY